MIRRLLGQPVQTIGQRLLIDSTTYELHREDFVREPDCPACGELSGGAATGDATLADIYAEERETASQNALVLDPLMRHLVPGSPGRRVLDIGCGSGHESIRLALAGSDVVAIDTREKMLALAERRAKEAGVSERITLMDVPTIELEGPFDDVLCLNVLDHLEDPQPTIADIARLASSKGRVVISLPHPIKDRGGWRKERIEGRWRYREFVLEEYFDEGPVSKSRENSLGDTVIESIVTFHRTTETWARLFLDAGLTIQGLHEPAADPDRKDELPILYQKSSQIPYFQLFVLERSSGMGGTGLEPVTSSL